MCAPVLGVLSFVGSAAQSVGGFMSQQAQADASNEAAIQNYKYQLAQRENKWRQTLTAWNHKRLEYKKATQEHKEAAHRGYAQEQQRLNELYQKAAFTNQDQLIQLMQAQGKWGAMGNSGQSSQRINAMMVAQYGRNQAIQAESLFSARNAYKLQADQIRADWKGANNKAYSQVALAPVADFAPPAPVMDPGPNALSLVGGLASAAVSGASMFAKHTPPSGGSFGVGGQNVPSYSQWSPVDYGGSSIPKWNWSNTNTFDWNAGNLWSVGS